MPITLPVNSCLREGDWPRDLEPIVIQTSAQQNTNCKPVIIFLLICTSPDSTLITSRPPGAPRQYRELPEVHVHQTILARHRPKTWLYRRSISQT